VFLTTSEGRKLKKRLEDLEHQVAFSSGFPSLEVKHADPHLVNLSSFRSSPHMSHIEESNNVDSHDCSSDAYDYPYWHPADNKVSLSYQHTRQLSTSPSPSFSHQAYATITQSQYTLSNSDYMTYPIPISSSYVVHPSTTTCQSLKPDVIKPEVYEKDDMDPFTLKYASMAGVNVTSRFIYQTPVVDASHPQPSSGRTS
jgi:hypothetical protein